MKKSTTILLAGFASLSVMGHAYAASSEAEEAYRAAKNNASESYKVAREKCNQLSGNPKDLCIEEARAAHTKTVVDAKSGKEIREVQKDATEDKLDADYKVELERCERLGSTTKDACVAAVKAKYGK